MKPPCGKCHRTGTDLIEVNGFDWCPDCQKWHLYQSHGWRGRDSVSRKHDLGCANTATNITSILLSTHRVYPEGLFFLSVERSDGSTIDRLIPYKKWNSIFRLLARDQKLFRLAERKTVNWETSETSLVEYRLKGA